MVTLEEGAWKRDKKYKSLNQFWDKKYESLNQFCESVPDWGREHERGKSKAIFSTNYGSQNQAA